MLNLLSKIKDLPLYSKVIGGVAAALLVGVVIVIAVSNSAEPSAGESNTATSSTYQESTPDPTVSTTKARELSEVMFSDDMYATKRDKLWGVVNENGDIIIDFIYNSASEKFSDGLWLVSKWDSWGYVNAENEPVISLSYEACGEFSEGLAAVKKDGKWGFANKKGEMVIQCIYEDCGNFAEGLCAVKKDGYWGFINKDNKTVIEFLYDDVGAKSLEDEMNRVSSQTNFRYGFIGVKLNYAYGVINKAGEYIIPLNKEHNSFIIEEKFFCHENLDNYSIFDHDGKLLAKGDIGAFTPDKIFIKSNDNDHLLSMDYTGQILTDFTEMYKNSFVNDKYCEDFAIDGTVEINGKQYFRIYARMHSYRYYNYLDLDDQLLFATSIRGGNIEDYGINNTLIVSNEYGLGVKSTEFYSSDGTKIKAFEENYDLWHDDIIVSKTHIVSAIDDSVNYEFSSINIVSDNTAIVTETNGIFQGLFVGEGLAYATEYNSVTYDITADVFTFQKGNEQTKIRVARNGRIIELGE